MLKSTINLSNDEILIDHALLLTTVCVTSTRQGIIQLHRSRYNFGNDNIHSIVTRLPVQSISVYEGCPWLQSLLVDNETQPTKIMHIYEYCKTITASGSAHMNMKVINDDQDVRPRYQQHITQQRDKNSLSATKFPVQWYAWHKQ